MPPGVVTVTSTALLKSLLLAGGLTMVIWVSLLTVKPLVATDTGPKETVIVLVKAVPVITAVVPLPLLLESLGAEAASFRK